MHKLQFHENWEDPGKVRGAELAATWARFQIFADGLNLTEFADEYNPGIRDALHIPVYPIAEWLAANWWQLWYESGFRRSHNDAPAHRLRDAEDGFALPDLTLWSNEDSMDLESAPYRHHHSRLRFLNPVHMSIPLEDCRSESSRLIETVLERLAEKGIFQTFLQHEWEAISRIESNFDGPEALFCRSAAQMGLDPFDISPVDAERIEVSIRTLPQSIHADFFEIGQPDSLALSTRELSRFFGSSPMDAAQHSPVSSKPPWDEGYELAKFLRRKYGFRSGSVKSPQELFASIPPLEKRMHLTEVAVDNVDVALFSSKDASGSIQCAIRPGRSDSRLFRACRALGEIEFTEVLAPKLLTASRSRHAQKRSRAFAAEFLAPANEIESRIGSGVVLQERIDEIASEFNVSPFVIEDQIRNHNLAAIQA